jgi:hypothetical protein
MTTLSEALEQIFASLREDARNNLEAARGGTLPDSSQSEPLRGGGSVDVSFHLDGQGRYSYENEQYGAGATVSVTGVIDYPEAIYSLKIISSDGGGGAWDNIKAGQPVSCKINTSFWHKTKLAIALKANVANVDGKATITYKY